MMNKVLVFVFPLFLVHLIAARFQHSKLHEWSDIQDKNLENQLQSEGSSIIPLDLVLLPDEYENERCLDGTPFGYFIRRADPSSENKDKWIIFLQGGDSNLIFLPAI